MPIVELLEHRGNHLALLLTRRHEWLGMIALPAWIPHLKAVTTALLADDLARLQEVAILAEVQFSISLHVHVSR